MSNLTSQQRDGDYTYHSGNTWKAEPDSGSLDGPIKSITAASTSNAHLFVYMCKDPAFYGTIGLAWVGTLCGPNSWKGYKASINEKRASAVSTAEVPPKIYSCETRETLLNSFTGCCS